MACYLIIPTTTGLLVMRVLKHNQSCVAHYLYNNSAVTWICMDALQWLTGVICTAVGI